METKEWISVKDRLPKIGKNDWSVPCLVCGAIAFQKDTKYVIGTGCMDDNEIWYSHDDCGNYLHMLTHWMPLPDPPSLSQGVG